MYYKDPLIIVTNYAYTFQGLEWDLIQNTESKFSKVCDHRVAIMKWKGEVKLGGSRSMPPWKMFLKVIISKIVQSEGISWLNWKV